jgi:thiamine monophosphate kinase
VPGKDAVQLLDAWKQQFPKVKLSCIGKIVAGEGITLRDRNGVQKLDARGYAHFGPMLCPKMY